MVSPPLIDAELVQKAAMGSQLGKFVLQLWKTTRINWSFADGMLASAFRDNRSLNGRERRFVSETLFGMIRHFRRVDEALRVGGVVAHNAAPDRERLLAYWVLEGGLHVDSAHEVAPHVDFVRVAEIDTLLARESNGARRIARMHSLPDWLAKRLVKEMGAASANEFAAALNQRASVTLRVNTLRTTRDALVARLADAGVGTTLGEYADTALYVDERTNVLSLPSFREGAFELQDEGSQLIASVVAPPARSLVVDACAGAGGKTLSLAAALQGRGRVIGADVDARKLNELTRRARRATATNVQTVELDHSDHLPASLERIAGTVTRVLIDAPCSGIGALRRNPGARWRLTESDLTRMPALQRRIAERMAPLLAPGGRLIYATCTVLKAENESVVESIRDTVPGLSLVPVKDIVGSELAPQVCDETGMFLNVVPHQHGTDGFFAAVLQFEPHNAQHA